MKRPPLIIPDTVEVPRAECHTLSNGVHLYAIPCDDFEVLRFTFVFRAGTVVQRVPFSASSTLNLLSEGSERMTARQIAEQLDFYGSNFEVNMDRDFVYVTFNTLTKFFTPTLEVAEQILLHPTFPEEELTSYREKAQAGARHRAHEGRYGGPRTLRQGALRGEAPLRDHLSRECLRHADTR